MSGLRSTVSPLCDAGPSAEAPLPDTARKRSDSGRGAPQAPPWRTIRPARVRRSGLFEHLDGVDRCAWCHRHRVHAVCRYRAALRVVRNSKALVSVLSQKGSIERPANPIMEPARLTVCAIMLSRRAAHLGLGCTKQAFH
jgi:hypothetical protein